MYPLSLCRRPATPVILTSVPFPVSGSTNEELWMSSREHHRHVPCDLPKRGTWGECHVEVAEFFLRRQHGHTRDAKRP